MNRLKHALAGGTMNTVTRTYSVTIPSIKIEHPANWSARRVARFIKDEVPLEANLALSGSIEVAGGPWYVKRRTRKK